MLERRYALSPCSRLEPAGAGAVLRCEHPLQRIELNESAARLLGALSAPPAREATPLHDLAAGVTAETAAFLDELVLRGALLADYRLVPARDPLPLEVIVPAYGDPERLARCLAGLAAAAAQLPGAPPEVRVTVVDDASPTPLAEAVAPPVGLRVRWLRLPANGGPATARNAGAATPWPEGADPAPWLAFTDSDCVPEPDWLARLAALLADPFVAAAGGAVRGLAQAGLLARYEDACASLHMGERAGPVALPAGGVPYLPSCNLAVRRAAFAAVGGFRAGWRFGEDVDLSWRLRAAGHALFYHPAAAVAHDHRTRPGPFFARRRAYARSEAALRRAHPGRFVPMLSPAAGAALAGAAAALLSAQPAWLLPTAGLVGVGVAQPWWRERRARNGPGRPPWPARVLLAAGLRREGARWLLRARQLTRRALVLWLPALVLWPRLLPLGVALFAAGALGEWLARRPAGGSLRFVPTFLAGYGFECLAYSAGRLEGMLGSLRAWRRCEGAPCAPRKVGPDC